MITEYRQDKIEGICLAYVAKLFAHSLNPKNRGPTFTWHKFPDMRVKHSKDWLYYIMQGVRLCGNASRKDLNRRVSLC